MHRLAKAASWVFFCAVMYLILTEAIAPWLYLPDLGNIGFTVVFVLFAIAHCGALFGPRFTVFFFGISAVVSYVLEETGVRTGMVFGHYHYSDMLGAKLGHVPIIVPLAWFMMIYPSWMVARAILRAIDTRTLAGIFVLAFAAALVMTGWDMVMDPGMSAAHNWIWEHGGAYFGVPRRNYLGWLLTTFIVYCICGLIWRNLKAAATSSRVFASLPVIVYAFFALRYLLNNHRFPALQVVAAFSMALPSFLAMVQLWSDKEAEKQNPILAA